MNFVFTVRELVRFRLTILEIRIKLTLIKYFKTKERCGSHIALFVFWRKGRKGNMEKLSSMIATIDDFVWGPVMLILLVGTGIF